MISSKALRFTRSLCVFGVLCAPTRVFAQQSHAHADTSKSAHSMAGMHMDAAPDWRMEAMAKHMAYSNPRALTTADSVRAAQVINELRQAIAKYSDVKVAEADG